MKLITCTGYGATGSSVVSDLLKEFEDVKSFGDFEFRFIQDPHGLRDLEYGLFENNNRLNTDYHIKQFIKYFNFLSKSFHYHYESYFNGQFKHISNEFIKDIIDVEWDGHWHQDIIDETMIKKFFYYTERIIQKKLFKQRYSGANYYKNKMYYSNLTKKEFYQKVRKYNNALINSMNVDSKYNFLVLDQLVPPDHNETYLNYFDNLKVIIVDRDPRDLYLLEKYQYKHKWVPYENIKTYVKWYRLIREHRKIEKLNKNILYIYFEDFIYDYNHTIDKILKFTNIRKEDWIKQKKYFDPNISIKNTKKWLVYPQAREEIRIIEKELKEFLVEY